VTGRRLERAYAGAVGFIQQAYVRTPGAQAAEEIERDGDSRAGAISVAGHEHVTVSDQRGRDAFACAILGADVSRCQRDLRRKDAGGRRRERAVARLRDLAARRNIMLDSPSAFRIAASVLVLRCARCHNEETLGLMVLKTQPEHRATIRRMAPLPGSGMRQDQVPALAQAFEELLSQ